MNSPGIDNEELGITAEATRSFTVLLAYEDLRAGVRARQAFEHVASKLELEVDYKVDLWKFDLLRDPALREQAVIEAARADIVFLSAHGAGELPGVVSQWLEQWLDRRGGEPAALAVLMDTPGKGTAATRQRLEMLRARALAAGVEVFLHGFEQVPLMQQSMSDGTSWLEENRTTRSDELLHGSALHPFRDWGINE